MKRVIFFCAIVLAVMTACASQTSAVGAQPPASAPVAPTLDNSQAAPASTNGYPFGYATYYVAERRDVPPVWGMAKMWYAQAQAAGWQVGSAPRPGAIAWSSAGASGHVALAEGVSADGTLVDISEMNGPGGGWGKVTYRTVPAGAFKYIY